MKERGVIHRVNWDAKGSCPGGVDEVVASGPIHVERMSATHIWASLGGHSFDFIAEKGPHGWCLRWEPQDRQSLTRATLLTPPAEGRSHG